MVSQETIATELLGQITKIKHSQALISLRVLLIVLHYGVKISMANVTREAFKKYENVVLLLQVVLAVFWSEL